MEFIETSIFSRKADELLTSEEQRRLHNSLVRNPKQGALIKSSGGLRKMRFGFAGAGKRGGVRTIYYYHEGGNRIILLLLYSKSSQDNLSEIQLKTLRKAIERDLR